MRANIIIFLLWLMISKLPAQNDINIWYKDCTNCATDDEDSGKNYVYSASQKFQVEDINHNFDRRNTGSSGATTWHRGWDINLGGTADKGDIIVSNVNGNSEILDIDPRLNSKNEITLVVVTVAADNNSNNAFSYLHGWRNFEKPSVGVRSGDLVLLDPYMKNQYCILDTKNKTAWCEVEYDGDPFEFEGDQYTESVISYTRQYGDPICPVGTSGAYSANGDPNYHTHVEVIKPFVNTDGYWNGLNARSPSVLLNINSSQKGLGNVVQQNPNIGVFNYNDIELPGDIIRYPGNNPTSIKTRIKIDGVNPNNTGGSYNKIAMVDQVHFLVDPKNKSTVSSLIVGKSLAGKIEIGSNNTRYPLSIITDIGKHFSGTNDGITGMESFAYNQTTGAHPWDEYYFADFAPRKFKNSSGDQFADFSSDAQYPDGTYNIAIGAKEAGPNNSWRHSKVHTFEIDNFLPYIHTVKVEAFNSSQSKQIYWRNWLQKDPGYSHMVANDGYLESSGVFNGTDYEYPTYYKVTAEASEPLEQLTCKINGLISYGVAANTEKTKWVCDLLGLILQDGNEYTLHFEGKDQSGNSLIKTHALATQATGQKIINPVRINTSGSNQWSPASNAITGFDEYHKLKITKGCGKFFKGQNEERGADCFAAAFEYQKLPDGYGVQFTNKSEGDPTGYNWDFGDGATSTEVNPGHEYAGPGEYVVVLTAYLNGEKDETSQTIKIDAVSSGGNLEVNITGNTTVALGSHQYYSPQVSGGYPPYTYLWSVDGDFTLGACPAYYSWPFKEEFDAEFKSPGCAVGASGNITLTVTDVENNSVSTSLPVVIDGEAPSCKLVWSGKPEINSEIDFKIVNNSFFQAIDCKDYYSYFDWYIEGIGNGYYDASYKNILWWLPGYKFADNGVYKVTAKGKKGLYAPYTGEFSTTIIIGQNVPPSPPNPPFELFPANTVEVNFGEKLSGDPLKNFYLALDYKNPLDQNDNNCGGNKSYDAQGYQFNLKVTSPGTGVTNTYYSANDLGADQVGSKFPLRGTPNNPIDLTIGPDSYGCNDITIEVFPSGVTCAEYDQLDGFCSPIGVTKLCSTYPGNYYIWSNCFTCPTNGENGKFKNYKYDLPIIIEKKCAFKFDPPQLVVNPAIVKTMDCGKTYLEANVTGGAPFTTGNYTPNGSPCAGTLQPYTKYEWTCYTMDDIPVPIDVLKTGNAKCVEINYDSKYFDKFWHETEVSFKVKLKVWDRLDDYSMREFYVTVNKPIRLEIPLVRTVCAGSSMVFNNGFPLVSGGSGDFTYHWSNTQFFNENFDENSASPQLDLPENQNGSASYTLLVTDNITGCTLSKVLTINFGSISVNAGPDIYTCIGPSLKKLGLPENETMVSGGDGNYTYEWNSSIGFENLSDIQSLRPTVKAIDNVSVTYYLEVRDGSGCYAKDEVVVTGGHELNFIAVAGIDKTICYKSESQIVGNSIAGGIYKWEVSPSQTLKKDNESILILTESFTKNAGTYTFKYTISDDIGCFSQDEMQLTVADQWKYIGYEPGVSYIIPKPPFSTSGELFDKVKPGLTQLPIIYTNTDNKGSGAVAPFTYSWLDLDVENKIIQNSKVVSSNGYLQLSTITNPKESGYLMKITDALGCSMNFHSNYFLLHAGQASMEVSTLNGEYFQCADAKLQFKVVYKTGYIGELPTKLPQQLSVEFDVQDWLKTSNTGDFGQFYQQGEISNGSLNLINSKEGIYEGIINLKKNNNFFNENFSDCGLQATHFFKIYVKATVPNLNIGVAKFNIYKSSNVQTINCYPATTITGPCSVPRRIWGQKVVAIGSSSSCGAGDLRVINGGQCDVRVGYADTNPEGIHLRNKIEVEEGSYFHAYIEPLCSGQNYKPVKNPIIIEDELPITNAVPQAYHKDGLLYPNPTTGKITLKRLNGEKRSSIINTISVHDIMGKQVKYSNISQDWSQSLELDVTHLKPGAYFIELISAIGEIYRFNFVKIEN